MELQGPPGMPMPPGALPARNVEKELELLLSKPTIRDRAKTEKYAKPLVSFRLLCHGACIIRVTGNCKAHSSLPCLASTTPVVQTLESS